MEQPEVNRLSSKNGPSFGQDPNTHKVFVGGDKIVPEASDAASFRKDLPSILLLFLLYILQGIPLGIMGTIPFVLQAHKVPYAQQAQFSIAGYPFGLKVLYAPIVDALYFERFGRRKSWLIPLQYLIAVFLFILTFYVEFLLDSGHVTVITAVFFILNFLCATQDITVDGWALTMLRRENLAYAATCNAAGQTLGGLMGYSGFLALNSASFANNFRTTPLNHGFASLPQFLFFWGIVFAVTTTGILFFKKEEDYAATSAQQMSITTCYKLLWKILRLRNMQYLIVFYLTVKMGTAAMDSMARLKLVENGAATEVLAFFSLPLIPIKLLLMVIISRYTTRSNTMGLYVAAVPFNIVCGLIIPVAIWWTPSFVLPSGQLPPTYYFILFVLFTIHLIPTFVMSLAGMSFSAKISDPAIGGTYITLINTISNVGGMWVTTVALWVVDYVTVHVQSCSGPIHDLFEKPIKYNTNFKQNRTMALIQNDTASHEVATNVTHYENLSTMQDSCWVKIDGYYVETLVCAVIGFLWLAWGRPTVLRLQKLPLESWRVVK